MGRPIDEDLRARVIAAIEAGSSARAAAARFGVGVATATRWHSRWRETGSYSSLPQGAVGRGSRLDEHEDYIAELIKNEPDIRLAELRKRLQKERNVSISMSALSRFLRR